MSRLVLELEAVLEGLIAEHVKLLAHVTTHQKAMRAFDLKIMDAAAAQQDACRVRIGAGEGRRKLLVQQIVKALRTEPNLTVTQLANLLPPRREALLKLRDELRAVVLAVSAKSTVSARIASAVGGHLNTAVRLLAGAVEKAGVYTRNGTPNLSRRIGGMEAVG